MSDPDNFRNTISYGTFINNAGGVIPLMAGAWVDFPLVTAPAIEYGIPEVKDIIASDQGCGVIARQWGSYFVDFSFIAGLGDGKTYSVAPFLAGVQIEKYKIKFYQQPTSMKYEVSLSFIVGLTPENIGGVERLTFKIYVDTVPVLDLTAANIKLTIFNLQQLGIH